MCSTKMSLDEKIDFCQQIVNSIFEDRKSYETNAELKLFVSPKKKNKCGILDVTHIESKIRLYLTVNPSTKSIFCTISQNGTQKCVLEFRKHVHVVNTNGYNSTLLSKLVEYIPQLKAVKSLHPVL